VLAAVTPRTRLAVLDHVTSPTGILFPIETLVSELQGRGVDVLVDGAHALGMLPLDLDRLGAAYYTANAHKWLCAPKGAAFLHVRRDRQDRIRPLVVSHGASSPRTDLSRFAWNSTGWGPTTPPHPCASGVPELPGHAGARWNPRPHAAQPGAGAGGPPDRGGRAPGPPPLSRPHAGKPGHPAPSRRGIGPGRRLPRDRPPAAFPLGPPSHRGSDHDLAEGAKRWVRLSAQAYNTPQQYTKLGEALRELLA
jgi:isopenicillin-N epimerase